MVVVADDAAVRALNGWLRRRPALARWAGVLSSRLAVVEIALMVLLAASGRRRSAARMLASVAAVYAASEVLGRAWPRARPFERVADVEALAPHTAGRSFPSRHVASGLAMATIGGQEHARLGWLMTVVAWLLGGARVAAGLHYPTDVAVGVLVGRAIGALFRP